MTLHDDGLHRRPTAAQRSRRPLLAGHRRGDRTRARPGPTLAPLGPQLRLPGGASGGHRGSGRRGPDRTAPITPDPSDSSGSPTRTTNDPVGQAEDAWRIDLASDGRNSESIERRVARGQILYDAPGGRGPVPGTRGCAQLSGSAAYRSRAHHVHRCGGRGRSSPARGVSRPGVGTCWVGSTIFAPAVVRSVLDLPADWGTVGGSGNWLSAGAPGARASRHRRAIGWCDGERARLRSPVVDGLAGAGSRPECAAARCASLLLARPDSCERACVPGHVTASTLVVSEAGDQSTADPAPRLGRWVQLGGHCGTPTKT